jgi:hypothetical protein
MLSSAFEMVEILAVYLFVVYNECYYPLFLNHGIFPTNSQTCSGGVP